MLPVFNWYVTNGGLRVQSFLAAGHLSAGSFLAGGMAEIRQVHTKAGENAKRRGALGRQYPR